jgi:hypothetical protein
MAGEISSLTEVDAPSGPLQVEVLDTADTTMSSNGTNKRATLAGPYLIETITNGSAGEFDFASIPAGFSRLIIKGEARLSATSTSSIKMYINADTTDANYHFQQITAVDDGVIDTEGSTAVIAVLPTSSSPADSYARILATIEGYAGANLKQVRCEADSYVATDSVRVGTIVNVSSITAAITRLRIQASDHPTSGILGTLSLYGEI